MLGVGGLPPPSAPPLLLKRAAITNSNSFSIIFQGQTQKARVPFFPESLRNYSPFFPGRTGFFVFSQNKKIASGISQNEDFVEEEEFDIDEGYAFDDENEDFDDEDEDFDGEGDDVIVPFQKMNAWLKNKPRGFGEGKLYDTSIEDKLLVEIEQSRKAQLANVNKLKNEPKQPNPFEELNKELKDVPSEIRVRINNLPKKKNIQRDLKSAFEGVPGLISLLPVVSGSKKTRDPVCKGFAFVDFNSLEDAKRFVQMFSGQNISFGKIEKNIKCEILKSHDASYEGSTQNGHHGTSESIVSFSEDDGDQDDDAQFWEDDEYGESDKDFDDEVREKFESLSALKQGNGDSTESNMKPSPDLLSSKSKENTMAVKKKSVAKKKPDKIPKLNIPGSAKRLKVREKAKLADVFSKYGSNQALASKEK